MHGLITLVLIFAIAIGLALFLVTHKPAGRLPPVAKLKRFYRR
jgi:hypothetical protein